MDGSNEWEDQKIEMVVNNNVGRYSLIQTNDANISRNNNNSDNSSYVADMQMITDQLSTMYKLVD